MNKTIRKGRTLRLTIKEFIASERFKLAVEAAYKGNPSYLEALILEIGFEAQEVTKNTLIRVYGKHYSLDKFEIKNLLRQHNEFETYNLWPKITPTEIKMIRADIDGEKEVFNECVAELTDTFLAYKK